MITEIKMPQLGESVIEGTIGRWLKQPGETVQRYEPLLEVETDKVDIEVPAPVSGTLLEISVAEGETVRVGTVIARIGAADGAAREPSLREPPRPAPVAAPTDGQNPFLSPVVARMLAAHHLDPAQITGSGQGGRVTKQDVLRFIEQKTFSVPTATLDLSPQPPTLSPQPPTLSPDSELIPLTPMRRAIAEHMERSVRTAPQVTTVIEVDMGRVVAHRAASRAAFAAQGVRLTFTPYVLQAALAGLRAAPVLNGSFSPQGISVYRRVHIGVAVSLDVGLIVPVLRDAGERSLLGLARDVGDLVERARSRQLRPDETTGGTFTVTNHGTTGSLFATPIINQPQSGILGVGAITKRPVVVSHADVDAIAIKPMCYLALTFDHRVADGAMGDAFLAAAKDFLETYT
ncbi:MAG: dihydrolipoamide acetyltransferase family protein [Chloroflexales bacterium]